MTKTFASQADLEEKQVSFTQISEHAWAYTAEGDPNTGIVIGRDAAMVIDTQATPVMADGVLYSTVGLTRQVVAIDAVTGELRWSFRFDEGARGRRSQ